MSLIRILFITLIFIITLQGEEMQKIETVWNDIELYWKTHDKKLVLGEGDTQNSIDEFEKKYNITLPQELIYSLQRNYQNSRQGRKALRYPWFGSNVGIDLLSIDEIKVFYHEEKEYSGLEDIKLPHISTVFIGNFSYANVVKWDDKWIPIVCNDDIPIVMFIDLDKRSKNYQKVIGLYDGYLEGVGDHFRFALIADNYIEFLTELKDIFLEYQKQTNDEMEATEDGKGFEFFYYEKKFQLPKGFWTDEYREEMIKKMGLK